MHTLPRNELLCQLFRGLKVAMNEGLAAMEVEKIKILGAVLELPAKQNCQFGLFTKNLGKMG